MSYEIRELISENDRIKISTIINRGKPESLSFMYKKNLIAGEEIFYDNDEWIKHRFMSALQAFVNLTPSETDREILEDISYLDIPEVYGMLQKAEGLGWI